MKKLAHDIKGCTSSLKIAAVALREKDPELAELVSVTLARLNDIAAKMEAQESSSHSISSLKKSPPEESLCGETTGRA